MASKNKKNKARNSYIYNGGEKSDCMRMKRIQYFNKQERNSIKKDTSNNIDMQ